MNSKPNFQLPKTKLCTVIINRNGANEEHLIDTPVNNNSLFDVVLRKFKAGFSQIRAVKAVQFGGNQVVA